ncbi:hypothetical protein LCGC14_0070980 [marine sediment metagenome]|jgi:hypothetical protein|uniref:Entericidin EcnA/B family protein n=2 Tax=root TaxID=1 RepID=A0A1I6HS66_9FLAO|nr:MULTISPECIES: hypothetical protein [Maribacter]SFR57110.1 hypothetical protein SAMN04488010_0648 [Maribacter stanieri]HDZ05450.1 hypothetical protein [Maribacter sp.]HEA80357.1 hypothetical protein [Maribacter sp.]|tara:strand:+ start:187 stop:369 length:183 start_codon:yes stop_codon:yes gene_type:complete
MKKSLLMIVFAFMTISVATSCREEKTAGEKMEEGIDDIGDGIEDGADEVEDAVEDATDDN